MRTELVIGGRYRHVRRGTTYTVVGLAKTQIGYKTLLGRAALGDLDKVCEHLEKISWVGYLGADGELFFRPETEFCDGRFVREEK